MGNVSYGKLVIIGAGFVLGEHGSTSFIPWNTVNIVVDWILWS